MSVAPRIAVRCSKPLRLPGKFAFTHTRSNTIHHGRILKPLRCYSTQGDRSEKSVNEASWTAISWLTCTPDRLSIEEVASQIGPNLQSANTNRTVPVLLTTPAFAPWFDPSSSLFEKCSTLLLKSLLGKVPPGAPVFGILGVVDKIPLPISREVGQQEEAFNSPDHVSALEGISLLLADRHDVKVKVLEPTQRRSLVFEEPALMLSAETTISYTRGSEEINSLEIGLRFANTVFVNGRDRTLLGMQWEYHSETDSYRLTRYHGLQKCHIRKPCNFVQSHLHIPLSPVSKRRKVLASMGNILRQVSKSEDGNSGDPMPASAELEKELPRHVIIDGVTTQRPSVWALVEPGETLADGKREICADIGVRVENGAKLHRVVSGGGGWGKKQGLLSLDPEVAFVEPGQFVSTSSVEDVFQDPKSTQPPVSKPNESHEAMQSPEGFLPSLSQVAQAGDYIQFFISAELERTPQELQMVSARENTFACNFSTIMPDETAKNAFDTQPDGPLTMTTTPHLVTLRNYFGAASENAIAYSKDPTSPSLKTNSGGPCTKLGVPGSSVVLGFQ